MKKNLVLFGILLVLLVATYFFQEKRAEKEYVESQTRDRVITQEITHLKLPHVEAVKKNGSWWSGDVLLSHNTFKQIERKLSEVSKIKDIQGEWKTYFPHPFQFEVNHEQWTIGDLSLDKQAFYIAQGKKIMLAEILGESTHLTQDETEIASIKLNELVTSLSKPFKDLKETQLFRFYPSLPLGQVVVEAEGSLPFELDFIKNETIPSPISGISVHKDLKGKFFSLLTQITMKEEVDFKTLKKFKKMGAIKFINPKETVLWELWLKDDKSADAYIIDPNTKHAYLMVGGTLRAFFIQLQDYWDKKVIPPQDFKSFTRTDAEFIQGEKSATVTIVNREPLAFEVKGFKVEQTKMEQLVHFIFNLGPQDQADRVSNLSKTERQQVLSENNLRIEVMGQELVLWRKTQELIVVNLTQGFKAHFNLLDENFRGTFEDVLK
ncbi:hypothetical protein ACJVC5_09580 [Peredibacter sp. HCB2-198]|uniref:hypothetical protein n=1 Tax=Peredibacter sp. HCB2-198 TaxID=3383025 RepID=UPI0038B494DD